MYRVYVIKPCTLTREHLGHECNGVKIIGQYASYLVAKVVALWVHGHVQRLTPVLSLIPHSEGPYR
jgi:hypothetical protein